MLTISPDQLKILEKATPPDSSDPTLENPLSSGIKRGVLAITPEQLSILGPPALPAEIPDPTHENELSVGTKQGLPTITPDQLKIFEQAAIQDFEGMMLLHIREFFPDHYEGLGEENSRLLVQHGIKQAALYGFISKCDVCKFIDLMLCFGVEFYSEEQEAWAPEILSDSSLTNASDKMEALFNAGIGRLTNRPG